MAVIDFPTSPINGQLFNAPNGVTYRWQSTPAPGLWLSGSGVASVSAGTTPPASPAPNALWWNSDAITGGGQLYVYYNDGNTAQWVPAATGSLPTTPGGDFCANHTSGYPTLTNTFTTLIPTQILSGNSGGWYSTSTGRYTPPAGRYCVYAAIGGPPAVACHVQLYVRKNGTPIVQSADTNAANSQYANPSASVIVDANGTDWFDIQGNSTNTTCVLNQLTFQAFPISGIKGPPGDPGVGLLQMVSFQTGAFASGTTIIPLDDTIPQITEGNEYMTLAITPRSATSKLVIEATAYITHSTGSAAMCMALFQDATANALASGTSSNITAALVQPTVLRHSMTSGTTSATTFRIRIGAHAAGTTTFNGSAGVRQYGGTLASSIVIQEVL